MRLLTITAFYPPHHSGGYELRCKEVMDGLRKKGHVILMLTNRCPVKNCKAHPDENNVHRSLHLKDPKDNVITQILHDCSDMNFIDRFVKKFCPDIIYLWHIQNLSNAILPYFSAQHLPIVHDEGGSGIAYLSRMHKRGIYFYKNESDSILKNFLKNGVYTLAKFGSRNLIKPDWIWPEHIQVYFNSQSGRQYALEQGVSVENAGVIHSGIDLSKFQYLDRDRICQPVKVIIPGRIKKLKGTMDGVALVQNLVKKEIPVQLRLIGDIQSDAYFEEITSTLQELGLQELVRYQPMVSQDELSRIYREADICFFPSYFNTGFSRVPLEAMASGCLIISYGNEGSKEIIQHTETGLLVPEGDIHSAADWIKVLIKESSKYRKMIRTAREKIEIYNRFENYVDSIESYLISTVNEFKSKEVINSFDNI